MQDQRPIALHSQALKGRSLSLSTYEKELLALVTAIKKWRTYLWGKPFYVKTDQQSLKYLLEQRIGTPTQQKWITKLLGYDFIVKYKKGKENKVADALSRRDTATSEGDAILLQVDDTYSGLVSTCCIISFPTPAWLADLKTSYETDQRVQGLLQSLQSGEQASKGFSL